MDASRRFATVLVVMAGLGFLIAYGCSNSAALNRSSANVKHLTQAEFANEVTNSAQPLVADFYATWCGPCLELAPLLDRVAGGYAGKIKFVKVNVDESPDVARQYGADALPLMVIFNEGKEAGRILGMPDEADLKGKLDALLLPKKPD